jgi:hypothetical protein
LDELAAIPADRREALGAGHLDLAVQRLADGRGVGDRFADHGGKVDRIRRRDEAVGLDPRQAHQILDDPEHPLRLAADGAAEPRDGRRVELLAVGQRLGITEHRRQRGAQLVARIGDEIDPHSLGRNG